MWAYIENNEIKETYQKLPKNDKDGTNLYSLKIIDKLYDNSGNVIIENHDFGTDFSALKERGYYKVQETNAPEYDAETHQAPILEYAFIDNEVVQVWTVIPKTAEQLEAERIQAWDSIRNTRNQLLAQSDWTQLADVPSNPAWIAYRQTLRDITDLFDTPEEVIWPEKPE